MKPIIKRMWWSWLSGILAATAVFVLLEAASTGTHYIGSYTVLVLVSIVVFAFPAYVILVIIHCWLVEKKNWPSTVAGFLVASGIVALLIVLPARLNWDYIRRGKEVLEMLPYVLGGGVYGLVYGMYRKKANPSTIN